MTEISIEMIKKSISQRGKGDIFVGYEEMLLSFLEGANKEIERLKKRIFEQAITISKLMPCATIDEEENTK